MGYGAGCTWPKKQPMQNHGSGSYDMHMHMHNSGVLVPSDFSFYRLLFPTNQAKDVLASSVVWQMRLGSFPRVPNA